MKLSREMTAKVLALAGEQKAPVGSDPYAELPLPPSVNNLFVTRGNRRFKSPEYRAWLALVIPKLSRLKRVAGPFEIVLTVFGEVSASRDIDNMIKPVVDACVKADVIGNDTIRQVRRVVAEMKWGSLGEPKVLVEVRTMEGMA